MVNNAPQDLYSSTSTEAIKPPNKYQNKFLQVQSRQPDAPAITIIALRSYIRPCDHIDTLAITSCPVPDLASVMYMHRRLHSSGMQQVKSLATPGTRHKCDLWCMYIQLARSGTGKDVMPGHQYDRGGVNVIAGA